MRIAKYEFTLTGFLIAFVLVAMFATVFGYLMGGLSTEYSVTNPESFAKYELYSANLSANAEILKDKTNIEQQNIVDIIGGYFSSGYSVLKTAVLSMNLFGTMMDDATDKIPQIDLFKTYLILIIVFALLVGVILTVLVKMRI